MRKIPPVIIAILLLFSCAQAAVCFRADDAYYLLNEDGAVIAPSGYYSDIQLLGDDLFAAKQNDLYALINFEGVRYTEFEYNEMKPAGDGNILIRKGQNWGVMDSSGAVLHKCAYSNILPSGTGAYWVFAGSRNDLHADPMLVLRADGGITGTGIRVLDADTTLGSGLMRALLAEENLYGYIDTTGKIAIDAQFDYAGCFTGGIACVVQNGKYGVIDTGGKFILAPEYDWIALSPAGGILALTADGNAALYNSSGKLIRQKQAVYAGFYGAYAYMIDDTSTLVFNADGDQILSLSASAGMQTGIGDDLILMDGAWGEECVYLYGSERKYQNIYPLGTAADARIYAYMTINAARYNNDLLGEIQYSTDPASARYGLIDSSGEIRITAQYRSIEYLQDDRFCVRTDDQWQMIDSSGNVYFSCAAADEESSSE